MGETTGSARRRRGSSRGVLFLALVMVAGVLTSIETGDIPAAPSCSSCRGPAPIQDEAGFCCDFHETPGSHRDTFLKQITDAYPLSSLEDDFDFNQYLLGCPHGVWLHPTPDHPPEQLDRAASRGQLYWIEDALGDEPPRLEVEAGALAVADRVGASEEAAILATQIARAIGPRYQSSYLKDLGDWLGASLTSSLADKLVITQTTHETGNLARQKSGGFVSIHVLALSRCRASSALVKAMRGLKLNRDHARRLSIQIDYVDEASNLQRAAGMDASPYMAIYQSQTKPMAKGELGFEVVQILVPYLETGAWTEPRTPLEYHRMPDPGCSVN